LQEVQI